MPDPRAATGRLARAAVAVSVAAALTATGLGAAGVLSPAAAVLVFVAVEVPLALTALALNAQRYRTLRRAGQGGVAALHQLVGATAARVLRAEVTVYRSLWLWARRRVDGQQPGVAPIGYARGALGVPLAFGVLTAVEVVAIHLLLPWAWLRTALLVASIYSLVWILGFVATRITHPHLLTGTHLILRDGAHTVATLDRDTITRVTRTRRYQPTTPTGADGQLHLPSPDGTNIDLHLTAPETAHLPGLLARQRRQTSITTAHLHLDDPHAFLNLMTTDQRDPTTTTRAG